MPTQFGGDEVDDDYNSNGFLDFIGIKKPSPVPMAPEDELAGRMFDEYNKIRDTKGQKAADDYVASVNRANKATTGLIGPGDPRAKKYPLGSTDPKRFPNLPQNRPAMKPFADPSVIQGPDPKLPPMSMGPMGPDYVGSPNNPIIYGDAKKGVMSKVVTQPTSSAAQDARWALENGVKIPEYGPEAPPAQPAQQEPAAKPMDSTVDRKADPYVPPTPLQKDDRFADNKFTDFLSGYQDSVANDRFIGRFGEAMATIGTQGKITPTQTGFFRDMVRDADKPTEEAVNALKLSVMAKDAREKADQYKSASDPNSEVSAAKRATLRAIYPMEASQIPNLDQLSAVEIDKFIDPTFKQGTLYQLQSSLGLGKMQNALDVTEAQNKGRVDLKKTAPAVDPNKVNPDGTLKTKPGTAGSASGKILPASAAKDIGSQNALIAYVDKIKKFKKDNKIETGPMTGMQGLTTGVIDQPNLRTFQNMVGKNLVQYVFNMSGKAVTDKEKQQLKALIPGIFTPDKSFDQGLDEFLDQVKKMRDSEVTSYGDAGYNVSRYASGGSGSVKTEEKRQYSPSQNKTYIFYSDGTKEVLNGRVTK